MPFYGTCVTPLAVPFVSNTGAARQVCADRDEQERPERRDQGGHPHLHHAHGRHPAQVPLQVGPYRHIHAIPFSTS